MSLSITLIEGDGVGPEIIQATCRVLKATGLKIDWEVCEAGQLSFKKGISSGVPAETIASLKRTKVALKGPLETPVGYGEKSANVTLRALFDTYANVRPVRCIPGIETPFSSRPIDFVIVRENLEDLYTGIEYMQTPSVAEALKLITRKGSEKIIRFAFELARAEGRKTVHCATKANILKLTEGLFKRVFEDISTDYPDIKAHHIIIDNCAHQMVVRPEMFDVIVTTNLHGDIISDLGSGLVGGLGLASAANIGREVSIFEAVHGSAPDIAGKNIVNPMALLFSAILMLRHLNEFDVAHFLEQALLYTVAVDHAFPKDLDKNSSLTTQEFADRVIGNLGKKTEFWPERTYRPLLLPALNKPVLPSSRKDLGIDVYIESELMPQELGESLTRIALPSPFELTMISNRGVRVFPVLPDLTPETTDHYRARFFLKESSNELIDKDILEFICHVGTHHRWMHIEKLSEFNNTPGFTKAQAED